MNFRYAFLFALESAGALIFLWKGIPFYRLFLSGDVDPSHTAKGWALLILLLIQIPYWFSWRHRLRFQVRNVSHDLMGHFVMFLGRLVFVFVGGLFSAVYYMKQATIDVSLDRSLILIALLFSMFCYTLELEKLGRSMID